MSKMESVGVESKVGSGNAAVTLDSDIRAEALRLARIGKLDWGIVCGRWLTDGCLLVRLSASTRRALAFELICNCRPPQRRHHSGGGCPKPEVDWSYEPEVCGWRSRVRRAIPDLLAGLCICCPVSLDEAPVNIEHLTCIKAFSDGLSIYVQQGYTQALRQAGAESFRLGWLRERGVSVLVAERRKAVVGFAMPVVLPGK